MGSEMCIRDRNIKLQSVEDGSRKSVERNRVKLSTVKNIKRCMVASRSKDSLFITAEDNITYEVPIPWFPVDIGEDLLLIDDSFVAVP